MEGSTFTVKEIVQDTNRKLDKFIDKMEDVVEKTDGRLDELEQHKASIVSNFKLAAWIIGSSGGLAGAIYFISMIK